jgi:hypothetical protein
MNRPDSLLSLIGCGLILALAAGVSALLFGMIGGLFGGLR